MHSKHRGPTTGRIAPAPENTLSSEGTARRDALKKILVGSAAIAAATVGQRAAAETVAKPITVPPWSKVIGKPVNFDPYGSPSPHEKNIVRRVSPGLTRTAQSSITFTPLQNLFGIITPSGLHFERDHGGLPDVDPHEHQLMVHGLVRAPKIYSMEELLRFPSVSRIHFIECGANTGMEWGQTAVPTVQYSHGMLGCSEFTGVPLSVLLNDVGYDAKKAKFILAEGADAASLTRSVPIAMALDDVMVVYGQNGEMLRPENGYPLRLIVPGVQGVSSVKWLRRIEVGDAPWNTREEALHYVDLLPGGKHRQYTWIQECKSVITSPSGGQKLLNPGYYQITGLAWSGRGKIRQVDISTDGGKNWSRAQLQEPILPKALTRFRADWSWDGRSPALFQSRAIDDTGYVQPKLRQLREVRGLLSIYHNNAIQTWKLDPSGEVANVQV